MHIPEDFVPDFTKHLATGQICSQHSKIRQIGNLSYISLFNRLNVWNIRTQELLFSLGTQKHRITCFDVQEDLALLGYENGSIEIIKSCGCMEERASKVLRLHSKRVTCLQKVGDMAVSSSSDGSLCTYDLAVEEVGIHFEGNSVSIDNFFANQSRILAACADKTIKIWELSSAQLVDAIAFDEYIFAVVSRGKEALVVLRSGDSNLVDLETREKKPFERFKRQRNMLLKDGRVIVQCQKRTTVYGITSKSGLGLTPLERIGTSQDYVSLDYDGCLVFLSKKNRVQYGDETIDFGFHEEEILDVRIDSNRIFSLSKDRICCWTRVQDSSLGEEGHDALSEEEQYVDARLDLHGSVAVKHATCLDIFSDFIVIGGSSGIQIFDKEFFEPKDEMALGNVLSIAAFGSVLAVSIGSVVHFYDTSFNETSAKSVPDTVTCSRFSKDGTLLVCSCLDSKVYVFEHPSMEPRSCLYGHSLPVRCLSVSQDSKLLVTAGADKLVKIWGLEFGECRKTLLGNTVSVEFMSSTLFMFCDKNIEYYDGARKLRHFRAFSPGLVKFGTDYMIATSEKGLSLFTMNKYEFMPVDDSSDMEDTAIKNIASIKDYDAFLDHLQKVGNDGSESAMSEFYAFIENSDMSELREYMYVLDHTFIRLILDTIEANISRNPIVNARVLMQLLRSHRDVCLSTDGFYRIKDQLLKKIRGLRDLYYINEAVLEVDMNRIDAEY